MTTFIFIIATVLAIFTFIGGAAQFIKYTKDKKLGLGILLFVIFTIIASMLMLLAVSVGYLFG